MKRFPLWVALLFIPVAEFLQYRFVADEQFYLSDYKNWLVIHQTHDIYMYLAMGLPWAFIYKEHTGKTKGIALIMMALCLLTIFWNFFNAHTDARFWMFWPIMVILVIIGISLTK